MKARLLLCFFACLIAFQGLSCSQENELDKVIDEALREEEFNDEVDEPVSVRYFEEDKAR